MPRPMLFRSEEELLWYDVWAEPDEKSPERWVVARLPVGGSPTGPELAAGHDGRPLLWADAASALDDTLHAAAAWQWA